MHVQKAADTQRSDALDSMTLGYTPPIALDMSELILPVVEHYLCSIVWGHCKVSLFIGEVVRICSRYSISGLGKGLDVCVHPCILICAACIGLQG